MQYIKKLLKKLGVKIKEEQPKINEDPVLYNTSDNGWGNAVSFLDKKQFKDGYEGSYKVTGHKDRKPKVGDVLKSEMVNSIMYFVFVEVKYCGNPHDMFFGDVVPYRQEIKKTGEVIGWELPVFKPQKKKGVKLTQQEVEALLLKITE